MEAKLSVKIPMERVGVVIGPKGKTKKSIEETTGVKLVVDSETGNIEIASTTDMKDASVILQVQNMIRAIGRGFSPERAARLLDEEVYLELVDIRDYVGRSRNAQERVRGRIIGKAGRAREVIEQVTKTYISVYGYSVSIVGLLQDIELAKRAIIMLIEGSFHKSVFNWLYQERGVQKKDFEIWEEASEETPPPRRRTR